MSIFAVPGGYDRAITVFSPDGHLFQVEYALEPVRQGATIIGISCLEGVVIGAEEKIESNLQDPDFSQKIYELDEHIGAAVVGLSSDARILVDQARVYAQSNRLMYDEPIDVEILAKKIGDIKQLYTQHAGVRPFGVSMIVGGIDKSGSKIFATDPSGAYISYKAHTLGIGRETVDGILGEEYQENMIMKEATKLAVKCLARSLETRREERNIRIAVIPSKTKKYEKLRNNEVKALIIAVKDEAPRKMN